MKSYFFLFSCFFRNASCNKRLLFSFSIKSISAELRSIVAGTILKPEISVSTATFSKEAPSTKNSYVDSSRSSTSTPKPVDAFPCGSKSIIRTFFFNCESAAAKLIVVVVLPTPPFWFVTEIIFAALDPLLGTRKLSYFQNY